MTDLISRQAAIDALGDAHFKNYGNAIMVIQVLPSAYPKKGKWIEKSTGGWHFYRCSECGDVEWDAPNNYCPYCGADMRGEE